MGRKCPTCETENGSGDTVVLGVFIDPIGPPGADVIKHAFCDYSCYKNWSGHDSFNGQSKGKKEYDEIDWSL